MKKILAKLLRYFSLKPRLLRLFLSSKTTKDMGWHSGDSKNDGMLRRPRDSKAWKQFNSIHNQFALDPRNMCLALAIDDFSPFGLLSTS